MTRIGFAYNQKPATRIRTPNGESSLVPSHAADRSDDLYAEWDSAETIDAVADALSEMGEVIRLDATEEFPERLRAERPDIVFNMAEGLTGPNREAHVPAILEFFGVPYSGSDPFTLSLCLDKPRTKEILSHHGVATPQFSLIHDLSELASLRRLGFPLFVKPAYEGSSKGITSQNICHSADDLRRVIGYLLREYNEPVLVEPFLPGEEFTVAVLGNGTDAASLPIVRLRFDTLPEGAPPIYGYEAKWLWDTVDEPLDIYECPAVIDEGLREEIEELALRAYRVVGCRDWARIDVRLSDRGVPNIIEINPLPGILPDPRDNSCLPKAARAAGVPYNELIQRCLLEAARRTGVRIDSAPVFNRLPRRSPVRGIRRTA